MRVLDETEDWQAEWAEQVYNVIHQFDLDTSNHLKDDELRGDADNEQEVSKEADSPDGTEDAEIIVPRKRARVSKIPSRVPVLVSVANLPAQ